MRSPRHQWDWRRTGRVRLSAERVAERRLFRQTQYRELVVLQVEWAYRQINVAFEDTACTEWKAATFADVMSLQADGLEKVMAMAEARACDGAVQ